MDIEQFWSPATGGLSWYDRCPVEVRAFADRLAELVNEKGVEPIWAAVHRYGKDTFGEPWPAAADTIMDTVRRLVEERS